MEMFLLLLAVCSGLGTSLLDAHFVEGKKRSVIIERIEDKMFHHDLHKRSPDEQMPLALYMRMKDRGQEVHLQLRKVPITETSSLTAHGTVKHDVSSIQDAAVYIDRRLGASVVVRKRESDPNNFDLEGSLLLGGTEVSLQPSSQETRDSENDANIHDVTPVKPNIDYGDDYIVIPKNETSSATASMKDTKRHSTEKHTVEVYFVADHTVLKGWREKFPSENKQQVKNRMALYYTGIAESINFHFESVAHIPLTPRLEINIYLLGLLIVETAANAPWVTVNLKSNGNLDASPSLSHFSSWIQSQTTFTIPRADHYMAFTAKKLIRKRNQHILGFAYVGSICSTLAVSIVEDQRNPIVATVAAHELGHSLNSNHDGTWGSSTCKWPIGMVMFNRVYYPSKGSANMRQNPWLFSTCSARAFQLKLRRVSCTQNHRPSPPASARLGQVYNADQQCQLAHGTNLCRRMYYVSDPSRKPDYHSLCYHMACCNYTNTNGWMYSIMAHEYTTCGNQKWCIKGLCVHSPDAPAAYDDCAQGDEAGYRCSLAMCKYSKRRARINHCCATCHQNPTPRAPTTSPTTTTTTTPIAPFCKKFKRLRLCSLCRYRWLRRRCRYCRC